MGIVHPSELVGCTFLLPEQEDGQWFRAEIVEAIGQFNDSLNVHLERRKFCLHINDDDNFEELVTYQQLMEYLDDDDNDPVYWKFRWIMSHKGPLHQHHPNYKGSMYNLMIEWENGEITSEPLSIIATDDPASCAQYASDNNLLNLVGSDLRS